MNKEYCVVFEGTGQPGSNKAGWRTIIVFHDESEFDEWYKKCTLNDVIIRKGISRLEAEKLIDEVPMEVWVQGALTAELSPQDVLDFANMALFAQLGGTQDAFWEAFSRTGPFSPTM